MHILAAPGIFETAVQVETEFFPVLVFDFKVYNGVVGVGYAFEQTAVFELTVIFQPGVPVLLFPCVHTAVVVTGAQTGLHCLGLVRVVVHTGLRSSIYAPFAGHSAALHSVIAYQHHRVSVHVLSARQHDQLFVLAVSGNHCIRIEENGRLPAFQTFLPADRASASRCLHIAEPALLVLFLEHHVHHFLLVFAGGHSREGRGVFVLVYDLDFVDDFGREVLYRHLGVIEEEGLAADSYLVYLFSAHGHASVLCDLHSRHLLQQVLKHIVGAYAESGGIVFQSIPLDRHRVGKGRNRGCIDVFRILLQTYKPEVLLIALYFIDLAEGLVAYAFHVYHVLALHHLLDFRLSLLIGECEVDYGGVARRHQIDCRIAQRVVAAGFCHVKDKSGVEGFLVLAYIETDDLGFGIYAAQENCGQGRKDFSDGVFSHWNLFFCHITQSRFQR